MFKVTEENTYRHFRRNERGFLLVITMLILVVLTVIGMAALDSSTFEVNIAANDRWSKVAFNLADGSVYSTSKLITEALEGAADPSYSSVTFSGFDTIDTAGKTSFTVPQGA